MFFLLLRGITWVIVGIFMWYFLTKIIPQKYLTWFGGITILAIIVFTVARSNHDYARNIWNIVSPLISPLGFSILLLSSSISEGIYKVKGQQVAAALSILLLFSIPIFSYSLAYQLVIDDGQQSSLLLDASDVQALIVLSDENVSKKSLTKEFSTDIILDSSLTSSLSYAADLYQELISSETSPKIFIFSEEDESERQPTASSKNAYIRSFLMEVKGMKMSEFEIILSESDIHSNAIAASDYLEESIYSEAPQAVVLISSAFQIHRATSTFEKLHITVIPRPISTFSVGRLNNSNVFNLMVQDFTPSIEAFLLSNKVFEEYLKSFVYFLKGW